MKNEPMGDYLECLFDTDEKAMEAMGRVLSKDNAKGLVKTDVKFSDEETAQRRPAVSFEMTDGPVTLKAVAALRDEVLTNVGGFPVGEPREDATTFTVYGGTGQWENGVMANIGGCIAKEMPDGVDLMHDDLDRIYGDGPSVNFFLTNYFDTRKALPCIAAPEYRLSAWAFRCRFQEQKGFSFEGQKAVDWLAKIGQEPEYDENGQVKPVNFDLTKLVSFFPEEDSETPDFGSFSSPVHDVEELTAFGVPLYRMDITIINHDDVEVHVTLYARQSFFERRPEEGDNVQGVLWLQGMLTSDIQSEYEASLQRRPESHTGSAFLDALDKYAGGKGFDDLMPLMKPLRNIRIRDGYVVDAFLCGDEDSFELRPYASAAGSEWRYLPELTDGKVTPDFDDRMFIHEYLAPELCGTVPPVEDYIECEFDRESVWEAYLLRSLGRFMPPLRKGSSGWRHLILSNWYLPTEGQVDCSDFMREPDMYPHVTMQGEDCAVVRCPFWSPSEGLCFERIPAVRYGKGLKFGKPEIQVLIKPKADKQ